MGSYERLSALDASFLEVEDESTHMHVAAVLIFEAAPLVREDGGLDIERIRSFIESVLHRVPRYRHRLAYIPVQHHPVWVDDASFNIQYHVRHTSLPRPGDERLLKRLAGRIMSQKLDPSKPLWELWVVEGLEGGRFALIMKAHHCMVDGISGIDVLSTMLRAEPDARVPEVPSWRPRPAPTRRQLVVGEILRRAEAPLALFGRACDAVRDPGETLAAAREAAAAVGETLAAGFSPASRTPLNPSHIGPHRRFDWARFGLDQVKEVKQEAGGTVNDVVLATVTGAVRRFLRSRSVRLKGLDFRAMVPVNVRPEPDRGKLGNRVAMLVRSLPIDEPDPLQRLRQVIESTRNLKRSKLVHGVELIEELSDWTATGLITQSVRLAARIRAYNLVVTNIPGPPVPLYLLGARMLQPYPMVPLYSNQALGIALFSYDGGLYWGLNSDWDRVPDLHDFAEGLALEFEELRKCAAAGTPRDP